jgi:2-methylisocitrate lyase-like PEP mutase family enzyme
MSGPAGVNDSESCTKAARFWLPHDDPILPRGLAVERVHAAVEAAQSLRYPFTLTARSENFIRGRPELDDTLSRLQAFEAVGADVLYAPGLPDAAAVRLVCASVTKPVNYVAGFGPARFTLGELTELGVCRVTIGTSFCRTALTAVVRAAREVLDNGSFRYADDIYTRGRHQRTHRSVRHKSLVRRARTRQAVTLRLNRF